MKEEVNLRILIFAYQELKLGSLRSLRSTQNAREQLSQDISPLVASAIIQEVGEYLSTLKGEVFEAKSRTLTYRNRLENLQ